MNKDLISRKALFRAWDAIPRDEDPNIIIDEMIKATQDAPAVAAVEVVRCKDCVYRGNASKCPMCFSEYFDSFETDYGMDCVVTDNTTDDGFCHKGARMDLEEQHE